MRHTHDTSLRSAARRGALARVLVAGLVAGTLVAPTSAPSTARADYVPLSEPRRLLDTRPGEATYDGQFAGVGLVPAGGVVQLPIAGRVGIPANAVSVVLNVTVTQPQAPGFVTVWPCDSPRPTASNLNYATGQTIPNSVFTRLSSGSVCLFSLAATHLVVDVGGEFPSDAFTPLPEPRRLLDSRPGASTYDGLRAGFGVVAAGTTVPLQVAGRAGLSGGTTLGVLNVTVTGPATAGFITVYPCSQSRPTASNLNFVTGQTVANAVVTGLVGDVCLFTSASTHLVVDVAGSLAGSTFTALPAPRRLLDTRPGEAAYDSQYADLGRRPAGATTTLRVGGRAGVPAGASSVILNVTVTGTQAPGFVTVHPRSTSRPSASNLNHAAGDTVANLVVAKLGTSGDLCLFTQADTHLVVDVIGYLTGPAQPTATTPCPTSGAPAMTTARVRNMLLPTGTCFQDGQRRQLVNGAQGNPLDLNLWVSDVVDTRLAIGDIDADGIADAAVIVSCNGGGTSVWQDLVIAPAGAEPFRVEVGTADLLPRGSSVRFIDEVSLVGRTVRIEWLAIENNEPQCCPQFTAFVNYVVDGPSLARTGYSVDSPEVQAQRITAALIAGDRTPVANKILLSVWNQVVGLGGRPTDSNAADRCTYNYNTSATTCLISLNIGFVSLGFTWGATTGWRATSVVGTAIGE